ncbi:alpha/beta fold hydrolase [Cytobacillus sp. Hm23]
MSSFLAGDVLNLDKLLNKDFIKLISEGIIMPFNETDHVQIYYEDCGDKNAAVLVLIPGIGAGHEMYKPQVDYFSTQFRIITIDLRGNGKSSELNMKKNAIIDKQSEDVINLLKKLHITKAVFLGVSYGGVVCQFIGINYPDYVKGLVIADSFCDTELAVIGRKYKISSYLAVPLYFLPRRALEHMTKATYKEWPVAAESMGQVIVNMRRSELVQQRLAVNKISYRKELYKIDAPTLVLMGDKMPIEWGEEIAHSIKNARLQTINHSFDPSNLCNAEQFNEYVDKFLRELSY